MPNEEDERGKSKEMCLFKESDGLSSGAKAQDTRTESTLVHKKFQLLVYGEIDEDPCSQNIKGRLWLRVH